MRPYLHMLKTYSQNTPHTNHCIARMLHRLAVDLKMEALLFQLSVFCLFNKILSDPAAAAYKVQYATSGHGSGWLHSRVLFNEMSHMGGDIWTYRFVATFSVKKKLLIVELNPNLILCPNLH